MLFLFAYEKERQPSPERPTTGAAHERCGPRAGEPAIGPFAEKPSHLNDIMWLQNHYSDRQRPCKNTLPLSCLCIGEVPDAPTHANTTSTGTG
jgi:hypothetical protein